jgi:2-polyprenyl-3-methyl-5-hydroxy-6-metoxy-1,4-benzoquinol methylase
LTTPSPYRRNYHPYGAHELILRQIPLGSTVLDVGCATGYLAQPLVARGCRVWGVDKDPDAVARAALCYEDTCAVDLEECERLPWPEAHFDVVLCADVLEHLRDSERALQLVRRYVAPQGLLVVSLPNVAHASVRVPLAFGRFNYRRTGILDETHVRLFTFKTAQDLVSASGFDITRVLGASDRFGGLLHRLGMAGRFLRGLLAYNIVIVATPRPPTA